MATLNYGKNAGLYTDSPISDSSSIFPFKPIVEPQNAEIMGLRNLKATTVPETLVGRTPLSTDPNIINNSYTGNASFDRTPSYPVPNQNTRMDTIGMMHGDLQASNSDETTSERYQQLLQKREEIRAKIVKLRANIDYQKKLRAQEMAKDPMWDIAKQEYIMKGDATQLNNIMSRFENEKTRVANQTSEANAKQESFVKVYRNKQRALDWAMQEYKKDDQKPENRQAVFSAYQDLYDAALDAGANILKDEQFIQNKYGINLRQMLNLDNIGSAKSNVTTGTDVNGGSTATQDLDNFNAAKDSGNLSKMSKAYKAAKESGKVNGNELNQMRNDLEAVYQKQKDAYDKEMESWNYADRIIAEWNKVKHDKETVQLFRDTYGNRGSWKKFIDAGPDYIKKVGEDKKPKAPVKDW